MNQESKDSVIFEGNMANFSDKNTDATILDLDTIDVPKPAQSSVPLNTTFTYTFTNYGFGDLSEEECMNGYKDGRVFSHFIEIWLAGRFPIEHISGCKSYDFIDMHHPTTLYDEKTFTPASGCIFCPSHMKGSGRKFDQEAFKSKASKLIFCIVSNVYFPEIKIKFIRGNELIESYPNGKIPKKDHDKFFKD